MIHKTETIATTSVAATINDGNGDDDDDGQDHDTVQVETGAYFALRDFQDKRTAINDNYPRGFIFRQLQMFPL